MTDEIIYCPSCNHKLRVPEDLLGTTVQCPMCNLTFTAPTRAPQVRPLPPQVQAVTPPPLPGPSPEDRPPPLSREAADSGPPPLPSWPPPGYGEPRIQPGSREPDESGYPRRQPPPGYGPPRGYGEAPDYYSDSSQDRKAAARRALLVPAIGLLVMGALGILLNIFRMISAFLPREPPPDIGLSPELREMMEQMTPTPGVEFALGLVFMLISVVTIVSAIQMIRLNTYWLALTGPIASFLNLTCCCCGLTMPFSIWALVVLMQPHVREAFD